MKFGLSRIALLTFILFCCSFHNSWADIANLPMLTVSTVNNQTTYSLSLKIVAVMTLLSMLPALLMTMTSFTRIIIILSILRQAIGIPNVPNNQILIGLALFITLFVMTPVVNKINDTALQPLMKNQINEQVALNNATDVLKQFMLKQTRKDDLQLFAKLAKVQLNSNQSVPMLTLMPAFLTSELKTAFQMGFILFLPFLIIDLVISSILMSMGMMMLSPLVISLPFKILLFVLVNGWTIVVGSIASSFAN